MKLFGVIAVVVHPKKILDDGTMLFCGILKVRIMFLIPTPFVFHIKQKGWGEKMMQCGAGIKEQIKCINRIHWAKFPRIGG